MELMNDSSPTTRCPLPSCRTSRPTTAFTDHVLTTLHPSAAAACRTVTHLPDLEDEDDDIYVHSSKQLAAPRLPTTALRFQNSRYPPRPEVHVTTDHIVMED